MESGNDDRGITVSPDTRPKPLVFVLMPFKAEFDDVYQLGIRDTCQRVGLHCQRADEQIFEGTILDNVYSQIARADIIVAEMTGRNPNVFYETGYAHALGKTVILLTQRAEDIPFDLTQYPHIVYESRITSLKEELEKRLRWCVENPKDSLSRVEFPLEFYVGKTKIEKNPKIGYRVRPDDNVQYIEFELGIHNASRRTVRSGQVQLALIAPADVPRSNQSEQAILLPDGRYLHMLQPLPGLFPDAWYLVTLGLSKSVRSSFPCGSEAQFIARGYTELGSRDYAFNLAFVPFEATSLAG